VTNYKRFAVYYAPQPGPLADFGAKWLGWDMAAGAPAPHPQIEGLDVPALTDTPRKYGLHGTVKPPFRLAPGRTVDDLAAALGALCDRQAPLTLDGLSLTRLGGFLALTVTGDTAPLNTLASTVVRDLDHFRAPLNASELERRRKARLSPRQETRLTQWGYPFVMEEFRFHITLTGRMPRAQAELTHALLSPLITPLLPQPFTVSALCLVGEDEAGMFHLIHRYALCGSSSASKAATA
jgi:putative phosphonate metabolism protein